MPSLIDIVAHTPLWVWPLMVGVLVLGWYGLRPTIVPPIRLAILPLIGVATSISTLLQSPQAGLATAGWGLALLVVLPVGYAIGCRRAVQWLPDGRLEIAGGWFMLVFGSAIFVTRYALGLLFGVLPTLETEPLWISISGGVGGAIAGIGLGWLAGVLLRAPWVRRTLWGLSGPPLALAAALGAIIAFSSPGELPRLQAGDSLPGSDTWNRAEIPAVSRVAARDGAPLTYRLYPARTDRAVVLVHGSSGTGASMHKLAQALQAAGASVYSISLRGHGGSGTRNGDSSYVSQLDDDLVDFVRAAGLSGSKVHRTLMGFSSGGGFVLRTAVGPNRALFDDYVAIAPYISHDSPTARPSSGGWASVAVPRIVALSILDGFGLPLFQGLPVVRFATAAKADDRRTPVYSFRLTTGMQLGRDWRAAIGRIDRPTAVIVGADDELFRADRYAPTLADLNPRIQVEVVPGFGHMDMIAQAKACAAVAALWRRLAIDERS